MDEDDSPPVDMNQESAIFDIEEWGGISYYVVNKNISATHELKCVCNSNNSLNNPELSF